MPSKSNKQPKTPSRPPKPSPSPSTPSYSSPSPSAAAAAAAAANAEGLSENQLRSFVSEAVFDSPSIDKLGQQNGNGHNLDSNIVQLQNCDELHLELFASAKVSMRNGSRGVLTKNYSGGTRDEVESVETSSPRTPASYSSRLHSPSSNTLSSVANKDSGLMDTNDKGLDTSEIRELLRDNTSKKLLQSCRDSKVHIYLPSEYEPVVSRQRSSLQNAIRFNRISSGVEDELPQLGREESLGQVYLYRTND
ncbi:hypothetical protein AKJ16_DCAP09425 [Drosera capensis]